MTMPGEQIDEMIERHQHNGAGVSGTRAGAGTGAADVGSSGRVLLPCEMGHRVGQSGGDNRSAEFSQRK